jgi:uncharacterized SAM-binding protein YcdF (DUF218 family)
MSRRHLRGVAILLAVAIIAGWWVVANAGSWLIVEDSLQHARAVAVLGGQVPFRAMEAARVYGQGWTREVWVTQGAAREDQIALSRMGIERPIDADYSVLVLDHLGVPRKAIRVLPANADNTADELRFVADELRRIGGERVILVTSKYHARRVRALWRMLVGARPEAVVRYTTDDPFDPDRWWKTTSDAMAVSREWLGLLNARIGFPIRSER